MQPRYTNLRKGPKPKKEYLLDYSNLCGGINLWDPDYRLKPNESPKMKNLLWRNGMLCSRKGQVFLNSSALGQGITAYQRLWHGHIFAHIGDGIYCFDVSDREEMPSRGEASVLARKETSAYALEQGLVRRTLPARQDAPSELNDEESFLPPCLKGVAERRCGSEWDAGGIPEPTA